MNAVPAASSMSEKKRIAVFASGNGTNLQALMDACQAQKIHGEIVVVVSNKKYVGALERAQKANIETLVFEPAKFKTRTVWCATIAKQLNDRNIDLICLAGFMLKLEPCIIRSFSNRIINIHPALLPKYGGKGMFGRHVHEAVLAAKEKESGCTIHVVDEFFDHGPILAQAKVNVEPTDTPDTLAEKIHKKEHALYVQVVSDICSNKIVIPARVEI